MQCKPNKNKQDVDIPPSDKTDFKAGSIAQDEVRSPNNTGVILPRNCKNSFFCS